MAGSGRHNLHRAQQLLLVERLRHGTERQRREAADHLLADFRGPALAVIHKTLAIHGQVGPEHAEEALQEATVKFLTRGVLAFRKQAAPRSYFCRIAINAALDICRRQGRTRWSRDGSFSDPEMLRAGRSQEPEAALQQRQLARRLVHCLERLAARYRQAVDLYYLNEAGDAASCAEQAGVSVEAFWQRLSRARVRLADCMRHGE